MKTSLYKKDSKGAIREWHIWNEDNIIIIQHGVIYGSLFEEIIEIETARGGKTIEEQVEIRMAHRISRKKDAGYVEDISKISSRPKNQLGFVLPMKAQTFKESFNIDWNNAYVQRKYNGHRCNMTNDDGPIVSYSRGGKLITSIDHIQQEVKLKHGETLDGELYVHGLKLQAISSRVRTQNITDKELTYMVYDIVMNAPFKERMMYLNETHHGYENILLAPTFKVSSIHEAYSYFRQFKKEGYEGAILRHGNDVYKPGQRARQVLKIKKVGNEGYEDDEFLIIDILPSKHGWARLVCITEKGLEFKVSAPGTMQEKTKIYHNRDMYIGKQVRVEYPELNESGIPSQPIAIMFRDKENE